MPPRYENTIVLNYRLTRKLGEGGFGTVYLAEHVELGRKAACKILHREYAEQIEVVERFFREAKAVCAIGHKAIIDIENFGRLPDGEPYYLMEFFPGESLMDRAKRKPLRTQEAIAVFGPVASALSAAHGKNIIHRDLKPENIMLLEEDNAIIDVKLLDFGIAKLVHEGDSVRSRTNVAMGTPAYMPPEQARDAKSVDQRGDVYSFGATVYAALAGRPAFVGESVANIILKVQIEPPPALVSFAPHVPPAAQTAIEHCMHKDPAQRPPTIKDAWREIKAALGAGDAVAESHPGLAVTMAPDAVSAAPTPAGPANTPALATTLGSAAAQDITKPPQHRRWLLPVAGLVVVAGGAAIFAATRSGAKSTPDAAVVASADASAMAIDAALQAVDAEPVAVDSAPAVAVADAAVAMPDARIVATPTGPRNVSAGDITKVSGAVPAFSGPVPGTISAKLCVDANGAVTAVTPLTTMSPPTKTELIAGLRSWRFKYKEPTAVCFTVVIKGGSPVAAGSGSAAVPGPGSGSATAPAVDCSISNLQRVCDQPSPSDADVNAAMRRLAQCRSKLPGDKYTNLMRCFTSKL